MIRAEDFDFHPRDPALSNWTETLAIVFSVPEEGISAHIYVLARPNLGVCHSSIMIHKGFRPNPWEIDYQDAQMHLPGPKHFDNFTLANGLSFRMTDSPRDFVCSYRGLDEACSFDFTFSGLVDPFDTHDPAENPLRAAAADGQAAVGFGGWSNGHMESIGHSLGELTLHGKRYRIDCVDGLNKSWGPRTDFGVRGTSWMHITSGPEFGVFLAFDLLVEKREVVYGPLRFGFVAEGGRKIGIVKANARAQRTAMLGMRIEVDFTDVEGREYHAVGTSVGAAPWYHFNPHCVSYESLFRFECEGRTGYSCVGDFMGMNFLSSGMNEA